MKILLEEGVWLSEGDGDPPRTLVKDSAKNFATASEAFLALDEARKFRPFKDAQLVDSFF